MRRLYDFKKAKKIIEENKDELAEAAMGMYEDWFWTGQPVWEKGKFIIDLDTPDLHIGGIDGSQWATPTLQLVFKEGEDKMIPCFTLIGEEMPFAEQVATIAEQQAIWTSGCLSSAVQENITPLSSE